MASQVHCCSCCGRTRGHVRGILFSGVASSANRERLRATSQHPRERDTRQEHRVRSHSGLTKHNGACCRVADGGAETPMAPSARAVILGGTAGLPPPLTPGAPDEEGGDSPTLQSHSPRKRGGQRPRAGSRETPSLGDSDGTPSPSPGPFSPVPSPPASSMGASQGASETICL